MMARLMKTASTATRLRRNLECKGDTMEKKTIVADQIITIDDFFSPAECAHGIELSESAGYGDAPISTRFGAVMNQEVRNNARVMRDDAEMAAMLWNRIRPFVPSPLWKRDAIGLNERLRFYRYDAGQTFKPHYDGSFKRDNGEKSQVTFMVYLNEDFEGGQTRFDLRYPHGQVDVVPRTGTALLFWHSLRHDGAPVTRGRKYVLRSDVMYGALPEGVSESSAEA
jgi:prolyl 4-hydroxylase